MLQKLMDFNPLDILAAAALGQKDGSSDVTAVSKEGSSHETAAAKDAIDGEEDPEEDMGKTTANHLKTRASIKDTTEAIMPPQKTPWSPDSFLAADREDHLDIKPGKISIIDIMQDLKNATFGKKEHILETNLEVNQTLGHNNNLVSVKNALNVQPALEYEPGEKDGDTVISKIDPNDVQAWSSKVSDNADHSSDTDTAESSESVAKCTDTDVRSPLQCDLISADHSYASLPGQPRSAGPLDYNVDEEDDVDVCSQSSPCTEDPEQRSQNMALDCSYLKSGIDSVSASTLDFYKISSFGRGRLPSSSSSTSSPTHEMSSKGTKEEEVDPTQCSNPSLQDLASPDKRATKYGKFRIGTFASFSSNNLELEKYLRNKDSPTGNGRKLNIGIPSDMSLISSSLSSPTASPSLHPLLHSPIQDWDRSEAGSEVHDDSSDSRTPHRLSPDFTSEKVTEWSHPLFHDHDYCFKEGETKVDDEECSSLKRKYTKRKSMVNHEKIMKAKYLKKELLKQEPPKRTAPEIDFSPIESSILKTNPVGRPKKRPLEKAPPEEEIDPETGAKMKITGKFQDQYVYYLSKSSRTTSRRRQTPLPLHPDKIIVPDPKPGDIIVPHLTDDDIETLRLKGRAALNLPGRPPATSSHPFGRQNHQSTPPTSHHGPDYDVDSHIVSTILSMENDNLSGAPSPDHPGIVSPTELNPNQPALTESLRLMSGNNSITSEHFLNFLLSVVDTSSSATFPSLPSDSVYSKVDHLEEPDLSSVKPSGTEATVSTSSNITPHFNPLSNSIHNSHLQSSDIFTSSVSKGDDDAGRLTDDLSSFMPNSQGTSSSSSSNTSQSLFGSDLSSLGTPQLSSSFPRLTSIEKTLDYLGVKDGDIKLDHQDIFNSKLHSETGSSTLLTPESTVSTDDDTPWIVTVTLYFNDVPAIMVNNQPYIRLVDIHKQILPAKDTGNLKKRCQLLKIPVLNCSEMQRYFLVQYGRAYNSKSTLIISKDQATELVTYYAVPQPRTGRPEESSPQGRGGDSSPANGVSSNGVSSSNGVPIKKRTNKNGKKTGPANGLVVPPDGQTDVVEPSSEVTGKRTRHKKVNYLEMLRGEEKKSSEDSIMETIECVIKGGPESGDQSTLKQKNKSVSSSKALKKGLKTNGMLEKNKKHDKHNKRRHSRQLSKGSKLKKDKDASIQNLGDEKIHIQDNEAWMRRLGTLVSDSEDSLDSSQAKSKFKPLKLKVNSLLNFSNQKKSPSSNSKKGLFSRSNSSASSSESPLRVLAVAHQSAVANSHLPSQPADIHLDLFVKSSSPCVRCQTCSQFLSVPHFMRHHHVPMDNEWLATEATHRILVPRNKENISDQEKKLWEEFHTLQEAIGGFGEKDEDDSDSEVESGEEYDLEEEDQSSLAMSGASSMMSSDTADQADPTYLVTQEDDSSSEEEDDDEEEEDVNSSAKSAINVLFNRQAQKMKMAMASRFGLVRRVPDAASRARQVESSNPNNQRTSSRKRKSKQLFSIENYYTPKRASQDEEPPLTSSIDKSGTAES